MVSPPNLAASLRAILRSSVETLSALRSTGPRLAVILTFTVRKRSQASTCDMLVTATRLPASSTFTQVQALARLTRVMANAIFFMGHSLAEAGDCWRLH